MPLQEGGVHPITSILPLKWRMSSAIFTFPFKGKVGMGMGLLRRKTKRNPFSNNKVITRDINIVILQQDRRSGNDIRV